MYESYDGEKFVVKRSIAGALATFIVGLLFLVIPYETLKDILFTFLGLGIIFINVIPCIMYWMHIDRDRTLLLPAILATISVVVGFVFIFWHNWVISIVLGVWLIVLPVIRIIQSKQRLEQLKKEIPYFLIAVLLFFVPAAKILEIVLKVFGGLIMLWSAGEIIYILIKNHKSDKSDKNNPGDGSAGSGERIIIDAEVKDIN